MALDISLELIEREKNFFTSNAPSTTEQLIYYTELQKFTDQIKADLSNAQELNKRAILRTIVSQSFHFVVAHNKNYSIFDCNTAISDDLFNASLFTTLCMFLYDTRRLKGLSLRKFVYLHSPTMGYSTSNSRHYFNYDRKARDHDSISSKILLAEDAKLRKYRERLLSSREVYNDSSEWSTIRKVSEHEWTLYFLLDTADDELRDTAKRIRNLYNGIYDAQKLSVVDAQITYDKFIKKLRRLPYEKILQLDKFFLEHIRKNPVYYGINLYRFERMSSLYSLTNEVNRLLKCKDEDEKNDILWKSIVLKNIHFPKLYEHFFGFENNDHILEYATTFSAFMRDFVHSCRLIIDKFVDEGMFGDDWENLFLGVINELVETVLYDPKTIDYSVQPDSQAMFIKVISTPVKLELASRLQK